MTYTLYNKAVGAAMALGLVLASTACRSGDDSTALVAVGAAELTEADIRRAVPAGLSEADSLAFVDAWVNTWISDRLISELAAGELPDGVMEQIDEAVEHYRRQLIAAEYREMAVAADTALAISPADVDAYYSENSAQLKLTEPMVRGIYIKIGADDPALTDVRRLYASPRQADIDRLEKVGLRGAIHYDYFRDQWIPWSQVISKIPREVAPGELHKGFRLDAEADGFVYLLSLSDVLPAGATMPPSAAEPLIREILDARRRGELDARLRARLRDRALSTGLLRDSRQQ